jgi:hypothetical protein
MGNLGDNDEEAADKQIAVGTAVCDRPLPAVTYIVARKSLRTIVENANWAREDKARH